MSTSRLKKFDLFSLPFQFSMTDNDRSKKTSFGGCISLLVIFLSLSYFIYLCYLYFGDLMQPSTFVLNQYYDKDYQRDIKNNLFGFKITLQNGQSLNDFEKETGKTYLTTLVLYTKKQNNGTEQSVHFKIIDCQDDNLQGYNCIDFSNVSGQSDSMPLKYVAGNLEAFKFQILLLYCTPAFQSVGTVCASALEIREQVLRLSTNVEIKIITKQFNSATRKYDNRIRRSCFSNQNSFSKTETNLSEGFIIQQTSTDSYVSDYQRTDTTNTYQYLQEELGLNLIVVVRLFLSESGKQENIQFAQFTTLLAQFSSIFNSLLAIGFICKIFAQNEIIQDFVELQLKVYYKKTAAELFQNIDNRKKTEEGIYGQIDQYSLYTKIQNMDYKYYISQYLQANLFKRLKLFIFSAFDSKKNDKDPKELKLYKQLINSTNKTMNIFEIQKDLMKIKMMMMMMMMMMILSVEQYAAIQLCGHKIDVDKNEYENTGLQNTPKIEMLKEEQIKVEGNLNMKQEINLTKLELDLNYNLTLENQKSDQEKQIINEQDFEQYNQSAESHLERIDKLEKDSKYFEKCLEQFLNKTASSSDLDKRILGCMIGADQMKIHAINKGLQYKKFNIENHK